MPVHRSQGPAQTAPCAEIERELSKLRTEVDALRKRKPADQTGTPASRLPLMLAGLSLLVSIIAMFRH